MKTKKKTMSIPAGKMTVSEAARACGVSERTFREDIAAGFFTVFAPRGRGRGRKRYVYCDEVKAAQEGGRDAAKALRIAKGRA